MTIRRTHTRGESAPSTTGLSLCPLFEGCSDHQLQSIADLVRPKTFAKGALIVRQGESSRGFFVIRSGMVHVHRLSVDGSEQLIRIFRAPESFAEASLFPNAIYPASARAHTEVELWLVPKVPFTQLLERDASLALAMISNLSRRIHALVEQFQNFRFGSSSERLCQWLLQHDPGHAGSQGFSVHLPESKAVLAAEIGVRQETLSRLLRRLQIRGVLRVHGREIFIPDRQVLVLGAQKK